MHVMAFLKQLGRCRVAAVAAAYDADSHGQAPSDGALILAAARRRGCAERASGVPIRQANPALPSDA
jgi:hypothetical protein